MMNPPARQINSPWISLVILLGLTLVCTFLLQFCVIVTDRLIQGNLTDLVGDAVGSYVDRPLTLYLLLIAGTLGTFLIPSMVLQRLETYFDYFPTANAKDYRLYLFVVVFLFGFSPLMQLIGDWNARMSFPESLKYIEEWMKTQEDSMKILTERIIMVDTLSLLFLNIFVMAVLPAIAEEYYFRGSLMHITQRFFNNYHLSVWVTAIIFSAIHMQFYGFFPRLLLGAFFGYMLVWTQNIWVPIIGHFINNALVTILAFSYARQGKSYEDLQNQDGYAVFVYIGSLVLTASVAYYFYRYTQRKQKM